MRRYAVVASVFGVLASVVPAHAATNDPGWADQWGLHRIGAESAWARSRGSGVTIAIVDTGVMSNHEDLAGKVVAGRDTVSNDSDPSDQHGHGTYVAGIAAAVTGNGRGIAGTASDARIMPVRVLGADGRATPGSVAAGVRWAADNSADVINLSLGADGLPVFALVPVLDDAVSYAWALGAVVVASAGNSNAQACESPAFSPFAICVGASTQSDTKWADSSYGARLDVVAPGVGITSTYWWKGAPSSTNIYATGTGTSAAAPFVSGVAALLMSMGASDLQARATIVCSVRDLGAPGYDLTYGYGLVQAQAAVDMYARGGCPL